MSLFESPFTIANEAVFWSDHEIRGAESETFGHCGGDWACDRHHVYFRDSRKLIDRNSFQFLNPLFVKDSNAVYDHTGTIKNADPSSFVVLDSGVIRHEASTLGGLSLEGYARDVSNVYYHEESANRAAVVRKADPESFQSLRNQFGIDQTSVYFQTRKLTGSNPASWVYLGGGWSMDKDRLFHCHAEITGVDRSSFYTLSRFPSSNFATDFNSYFLNGSPATDAEFWDRIDSDIASMKRKIEAGFHRARRTCKRCEGSGDCFCVRKNRPVSNCTRCGYTGVCNACKGIGRII